MKRFYVFMSIAMIVILVAAMSIMTLTTSAATVEVYDNVIYISDEIDNSKPGTGLTPDDPLKPYIPSDSLVNEQECSSQTYGGMYGKYYYRTALYQAAEKLVNTGGTIVICGEFNIGAYESYGSGDWHRDFNLPESDKPIVIRGNDASSVLSITWLISMS